MKAEIKMVIDIPEDFDYLEGGVEDSAWIAIKHFAELQHREKAKAESSNAELSFYHEMWANIIRNASWSYKEA
jgi:hypothetical protein